jgi:hypothetical protein
MKDIDDLIERNHRILSFEAARPRAILNLQNWVNGNGCIAREETAYLDHSKELLGVASPDETVMIGLETMVEDCLARLCQCFNKVSAVRMATRQIMAEVVIESSF